MAPHFYGGINMIYYVVLEKPIKTHGRERKYNLVNSYGRVFDSRFALNDKDARNVFLHFHPELKEKNVISFAEKKEESKEE